MCTSLACRQTEQDSKCILINNKGAAAGTTCASGKV